MSTRASRGLKFVNRAGLVIVGIAAVVAIGNVVHETWEFWDDDKDRGATAEGMDQADAMGDRFSSVVYPDQNWDASQSIWFYTTTQGADMLPYDFFMALEQKDSTTPFRDPGNMNRYRYLVQKATWSNPDGLPVGMVKDVYQGEAERKTSYMGFTCAACHTNQVNVVDPKTGKAAAIRIDGGPSGADMVGFLEGMAAALEQTRSDVGKRARFVKAVLDRGEYDDEKTVLADLDTYALRISMYNITNRSATRYGYARLDAFGRIFNRVLEHLLTRDQLEELVKGVPGLTPEQVKHVMDGAQGILTSEDREEITRRTLAALEANGRSEFGALKEVIKHLRNPVFNSPDAPVSYPFLWDIAQHDYVQWNGIGANAGVGPLGRNVGEVIGVFGTLDWHKTDQCRTSEKITGQCTLFGTPTQAELVRFESSVKMRNLRKIEEQLGDLMSPRWEDPKLAGVLPAPCPMQDAETEQAWKTRCDAVMARGEALYEEKCVRCHQAIDSRDPNRKVVAFMQDYKKAGTDPKMVENAVTYTGYSGFLKDLYVGAGDGNLVIQEKMPVAALLTYTTEGTVVTPNPDQSWLMSRISWLFDLYKSYSTNPVKSSLKQGDYPLDTTQGPYNSLQAYKGRPMNGIWATAPYLHNGSVPTLYDLLLPAECPADQPDCEKRPARFMVGSRELDTDKVGFKSGGYEGFEYLTSKTGNSNKGHEYGTTLSHEDRLALVIYMKTL